MVVRDVGGGGFIRISLDSAKKAVRERYRTINDTTPDAYKKCARPTKVNIYLRGKNKFSRTEHV